MFETLLYYINFGFLLIFGVFISAAFSGITINKKNTLILSGVSSLLIIFQIISYYLIGLDNTTKIYPLISHIPIILFLFFYYRRRITSSAFAVMTTYLCFQISKWFGLLGMLLFETEWSFYLIHIILNILIGFVLIHFIAPLISSILSKENKTVLIFSFLPIVYYLFDYIATVYTDWLYRGNQLAFEFSPFILAIAYLIFCILYFKEYEQKMDLERQNQIIEIKANQSVKEVCAIRSSAYEVSILRHDMRHHLQSIYSYVENGNTEKAIQYIKETLSAVDSTSVDRFCTNELVNLILSYYKGIMDNQGIAFDTSINIQETLPCSEQEFSSIISNGLENAVMAASEISNEKNTISLLLKSEGTKLLLSIKNPYKTEPVFSDGMPISSKSGHGLGTQSICYVTKKLKGNCQFTAANGIFTLRVVV